jgi:hypothetical protein
MAEQLNLRRLTGAEHEAMLGWYRGLREKQAEAYRASLRAAAAKCAP